MNRAMFAGSALSVPVIFARMASVMAYLSSSGVSSGFSFRSVSAKSRQWFSSAAVALRSWPS